MQRTPHYAIILTLTLCASLFLSLLPQNANAEELTLERRWKITQIGDETGKLLGFIKFNNGFIEGQSTCNSYSATYDLGENNTIVIHRVGVTQLICKIGNKMEIEKKYVKGLEVVKKYAIKGDELILYKEGDEELARFK